MKIIDILKKQSLLFSSIGMFLVISCISIAYASLDQTLMITGDVYVRADADIRVVDVQMVSAEEQAYETSISKYTINTNNMYVTLPKINSKITYQVTIRNKTDYVYLISEITDQLVNPNITYQLDNYDDVKVIPKNSTVTLNITFLYKGSTLPEDISQIATINYKFKRPHALHLNFDNSKAGTSCTDVQCSLDELYKIYGEFRG